MSVAQYRMVSLWAWITFGGCDTKNVYCLLQLCSYDEGKGTMLRYALITTVITSRTLAPK